VRMEISSTTVMSVASTSVLIGGATIAWMQYQASNRHAKQERTLHLDQSIDSLNGTRVQLETALPRSLSSITKNDVDAAAKGAHLPNLETLLRTVLARLQIFSLGVQSGMADEDFAFELLGSTIVWYGTAYQPYVQSIRDDNKQPLLYGDLLHLAARWTARLTLESRDYRAVGAPFFGRSKRSRRALRREVRRGRK
jgi:hypothetical protein